MRDKAKTLTFGTKNYSMQQKIDDITEWLIKILLLALYIGIGFMGSISLKKINAKGKKFIWAEVWPSFGITVFVGVLAFIFCILRSYNGAKMALYIIVSSYLAEKISLIIMAFPIKKIFFDSVDNMKKWTSPDE